MSETNNIKPEPELPSEDLVSRKTHQCPGPSPVPAPGLSSPSINISASLKAYADRMQADYFRYRLAKEG